MAGCKEIFGGCFEKLRLLNCLKTKKKKEMGIMMGFDFNQMIFSVLWLLTIITIILVKKEDRTAFEKIRYIIASKKLEDYAMIVVKYVEDMGGEQGMPGAGRRMVAVQALLDFRDKLDLDVTHEQIEMLIRAAYMTIQKEKEVTKTPCESEPDEFDFIKALSFPEIDND